MRPHRCGRSAVGRARASSAAGGARTPPALLIPVLPGTTRRVQRYDTEVVRERKGPEQACLDGPPGSIKGSRRECGLVLLGLTEPSERGHRGEWERSIGTA